MICIYRLHFISTCVFLDEFTEFLEMLSINYDNFFLSGDINLHLDTNEHYVTRAKELFLMLDLLQYADFPTHKLGHTLDPALARSDSPIISDIFPNNVLLSDHFMVCFNVLVSAPKTESKIVRYRNLKDVDFEQFKRESKEGYDNMPKGDMQCTVQNYNSVMQTLTDKYAPLISRKIRTRPSAL